MYGFYNNFFNLMQLENVVVHVIDLQSNLVFAYNMITYQIIGAVIDCHKIKKQNSVVKTQY